MCRVTMGHLRVTVGHPSVTVGHPMVTMGHLRLTVGYLRVTLGHLRVTIGNFFLSFTTTIFIDKSLYTCTQWLEYFVFIIINYFMVGFCKN